VHAFLYFPRRIYAALNIQYGRETATGNNAGIMHPRTDLHVVRISARLHHAINKFVWLLHYS